MRVRVLILLQKPISPNKRNVCSSRSKERLLCLRNFKAFFLFSNVCLVDKRKYPQNSIHLLNTIKTMNDSTHFVTPYRHVLQWQQPWEKPANAIPNKTWRVLDVTAQNIETSVNSELNTDQYCCVLTPEVDTRPKCRRRPGRIARSAFILQINCSLISIYIHVNSVGESSLQFVKAVHLYKCERHSCLHVNIRIHVKYDW